MKWIMEWHDASKDHGNWDNEINKYDCCGVWWVNMTNAISVSRWLHCAEQVRQYIKDRG